MDPEELVTLTNHGTMKLRSAVVRAMILSSKERKRATIVREGKPAILNFKQIRTLRAEWDEFGPPYRCAPDALSGDPKCKLRRDADRADYLKRRSSPGLVTNETGNCAPAELDASVVPAVSIVLAQPWLPFPRGAD